MNVFRYAVLGALIVFMAFMAITGKISWIVAGAIIIGTMAFIYWTLVRATRMPDMYEGSVWKKTPDGVSVLIPEWLQDYSMLVCRDIDEVNIRVALILWDYYEKEEVAPKDLNIIIMRSIGLFPNQASHTGYSSGDTSCGSPVTIRICLRPERDGSLEVLHSHGGYLAPLGWELKNAYNCKNAVGGHDFRPPDDVLRGINAVVQKVQFCKDGVFGEDWREI